MGFSFVDGIFLVILGMDWNVRELMSWGRLVCLIWVNSFPFVLFYDFMAILSNL